MMDIHAHRPGIALRILRRMKTAFPCTMPEKVSGAALGCTLRLEQQLPSCTAFATTNWRERRL